MIENTKPEQQVASDRMFSLAQRIFQGESGYWFAYCIEEDKFYVFKNGVWEVLFEVEILRMISEAFPNINRFPISTRNQVLENLKILTQKRLKQFNTIDALNFPEGLLKPKEGKLIEHHPDYFSTIRIPYSYNWNATCPLWEKTLLEIFDNDAEKSEVLKEYFGYCLTRDTTQHKALLLLGESRTGKSTILHVLRNLVGIKNCSSVPLKFISNPQYTPLLINKLVNIDSDVSGKAESFEAEFKVITSGEPVSVNQKFIATFEFNPYCKVVLAANEFPRITDHSSAFYKRLIVIPCDRVFEEEEQNKKLPELLIQELPGILNWAVEGLQRLIERGRFEQKDFMKDAVADLREESNPVEAFFKEHVVTDVSHDGIHIEKGFLYNKYVEWCKSNGNAPMSSIRFAQSVYRKYSKFTPKNCRGSSTSRPWIWKNLVYLDNYNQKDKTINWQE